MTARKDSFEKVARALSRMDGKAFVTRNGTVFDGPFELPGYTALIDRARALLAKRRGKGKVGR